MKNVHITLAALTCMLGGSLAATEAEIVAQNSMNCSNLSMEMQQFAGQLNAMNKKMFCGQFTDAQRLAAMQYAAKPDANGNMMSSDQAVQKVATENNMQMPGAKSPTGCPIK